MFKYQLENHWPPLAWLALCTPGNKTIIVHHGADVDTRPEWFCEAVWDDNYSAGAFDRTSVVFGSGGRIREESVNFVSSIFPAGRLQHIKVNHTNYLSNSLVCLAAFLDLHVDPWYPWYYEDFFSIEDGFDNHKAYLKTNMGDVTSTYVRNLSWDGKLLCPYDKPSSLLSFHDYSSYLGYLTSTLSRMLRNMHSSFRPFNYDSISTCSSGYDSLAVSVLSRHLNNQQVICVPGDRIGLDDSGVALVQQLEMTPLKIGRDDWRKDDFSEVSFFASDAGGRDVWLFAARKHLSRKVMLSGYFGDGAWQISNNTETPVYNMGGAGGLSISEFRLQQGFIHCPLPYLGSEHIDTIRAISSSPEMQPWVLNQHYDRPLPRRIIEEAGIKRGSFGVRKTAVNVHLFRRKEFDRFLAGTPSFRDYMSWIRKQSKLAPPPTEEYPLTVPAREKIEVPLFRQLFPWALERSKQNYKT